MASDPQPGSTPAAVATGARTRVRWGLYAPFIALALAVAGWSAYWLVARGAVVAGIDRALADAAARGDAWTCRDRQISGYPFRIEVRCAEVTLTRNAPLGVLEARLSGLVVVGQPQTPSHVVFEANGPLALRFAGGEQATLQWQSARGSHRLREGMLERVSVALERPVLAVAAGGSGTRTVSAATAELHVRRPPNRPVEEGARDLFLRAAQFVSGDLDALLGDANPSEIDLQAIVTRAEPLSRGVTPATLEAWRLAGGEAQVTRLALRKGLKQVEVSGTLMLDAQRRIAGRLEPSIANIDQVAGFRLRGGALDFATALSGRPPPATAEGLRPLPAVEMREGRVSLGPIRLPLPALSPLY